MAVSFLLRRSFKPGSQGLLAPWLSPPPSRPSSHHHLRVRRSLSTTSGDLGKGVDILAEEEGGKSQRTFLLGYDGQGFDVRDISYRGSILAFPNACFLYKPRKIEEITPEALSPILTAKPPIEIVIVGLGEKLEKPMPKESLEFLVSKGLAVEQMDTASACATFNILNQEDRRVAGVLLAVDEMAEDA